jgi:hypothetical protein
MGKTTAARHEGSGRRTSYRSPAEWLAAAGDDPRTAHDGWESAAGISVLPLGRLFDAVRVPDDTIHHAAGSSDPAEVSERLAAYLPGGAVIHDPIHRRYYCLTPPGTTSSWAATTAECLGAGTHLGVPHPDRTTPHPHDPYWILPLERPGGLCAVCTVLALVMVGRLIADTCQDDAESEAMT